MGKEADEGNEKKFAVKSCIESKVCKKDVEFVKIFFCKKTYLIEEEEELI